MASADYYGKVNQRENHDETYGSSACRMLPLKKDIVENGRQRRYKVCFDAPGPFRNEKANLRNQNCKEYDEGQSDRACKEILERTHTIANSKAVTARFYNLCNKEIETFYTLAYAVITVFIAVT